MSFTIYILLTNVGSQAGPFDLYSDVDNYAVPFDTNVPKSALTQYYSASVPDGTQTIRVKSLGDCVNFIDISIQNLPLPSVTPTNTPTVTPTNTVTPTVTQTPGLTSTPTPSLTPTKTATPTITPTITPTNTNTPSVTPTQGLSPTPSSTPTLTPTLTQTPSVTPTGSDIQLNVYGKYINNPSPGDLQYSINAGSNVNAGEITTTSCDFLFTISGLEIGDTLYFSDTSTYTMAGSSSSCPDGPGGFDCGVNYTVLSSGSQSVYLTVNGNNAC
jgi:hypothetical protein